MRIALYDGDGEKALATVDFSDDHLKTPAPWRVRVEGVMPQTVVLLLQASRVTLPAADGRIVRTWVATPYNELTARRLTQIFAGDEIDGVPPQHRPRFTEVALELLKSKG